MPFEDEFTSELRILAHDVDPAGPKRVQDSLASRERRRGHLKRAGLAFGLGMAVASAGVALLQWTDDQPSRQSEPAADTTPDPDFISFPKDPGEPCPAAQPSTLANLAMLDSPVWFPNSDHASPTNLSGAWVCGGVPTLDFGGITIAFEPGWTVEDPAKRWTEMSEQWGDGRVETILSRPAFVQDISESAPRGEVLVIVDTTLIRLLGEGKTPIKDLIDIVDSIDTKARLTVSSAADLSRITPARD